MWTTSHGPGSAGRHYETATGHLYRTEGDRLAEHWGVRDELGAPIQLGTVPAPSLWPTLAGRPDPSARDREGRMTP